MFKSQEKLIAEIHNEFDTAQDRLLQQAKSFLDKAPNNRVEEVGSRLAKVGFINSPTAKKAAIISKELVKSEEEANLIKYYKDTYPFLKFLTEEELNRICDKYKLIHAPVGNYIEEVPEKNLRCIEIAQAIKYRDEAPIITLIFLERDSFLLELASESIVSRCVDGFESVIRHNGYNTNECIQKTFGITTKLYKYDTMDYRTEVIDKSGLFIAAPSSHFNLEGLKKKSKHGFFSVFETEVKDPIVFRYVRGGIQVITKWGLEANDPSLVVEKLN